VNDVSDESDERPKKPQPSRAKKISTKSIIASSEEYPNPNSYMYDFKEESDEGLLNVTEITPSMVTKTSPPHLGSSV
jgi:hypothetical protein